MGDDTDDLEDYVSQFQAALGSKRVELPDVELSRVLVALDGSNQDPGTEAIAIALGHRHELDLAVMAEGGADAVGRSVAMSEAGVKARAVRAGRGNTAFERILDCAREHEADLIVVPSPFMADLETFGRESTGKTLDMLMSRAEQPLLVVREPLEDIERGLRDLLIPITFHSADNPRAVAWALRLLGDGGVVRLLAVADTATLESAAHLLGEYLDAHALDVDTLERLESREHAGLIAALQKAAAERRVDAKVKVRTGNPVEVVTEVANADYHLVVASCPSDRRSSDYQRVQAFVRESRNPVLIV